MKVLYVIDSLGPGGAERSLVEMLPPLERGGVQPTVVCFKRASVGFESEVRVNVKHLSGPGRLAKMAQLRRLTAVGRYDLVHTTLFESDVFGRSALAGLGVPILTSLVNMPPAPGHLRGGARVRLKHAAARALERATGALFACHFHAITDAVKEAAVGHLHVPREKITVIYRGRDQQRLGRRTAARREQLRRRIGVPEDAFVVLSVGRQEPQKGQRVLIEALSRLLAAVPHALLLVAGREGNATPDLREAVERAGVAAAVRFLGHVDAAPDLLAACDVFAFPSLWEGLGGAIIEAMALEAPCVASDLPPIREVTGGGRAALLVPPGDSGALAQAIARVHAEPELARRLAGAGRSTYTERFTLQASVEAMLVLYERLTSEDPRRR
ncbi:MAG: glycosyltransferase family 4 protein [Planctomycetes bacterium]|nr:glycosyltransferase family 4 protein [Planctomycetota bacterium]